MLTAALTALAFAAVAPAALRVADWYCRLITPAAPALPIARVVYIPPVPARRTATGQQACRLVLS